MKHLVIFAVLISFVFADTKNVKTINGVEVSYGCKLNEDDQLQSLSYWASGCPIKTKAKLLDAIMGSGNYYTSLPTCTPPTKLEVYGLPDKLGITLYDKIPPKYELIKENTTKTDFYLYNGLNDYSKVYIDVKNLAIYCHSLIAGYNWTADEYISQIKARFFTRTYEKKCETPDVSYPLLASNEEVAFTFDKKNDKSKECKQINGKVQKGLKKCKENFRCIIKLNDCPIEGSSHIASFVNHRNNSLHQDINLLDSGLTLYYNSNFLDVNLPIAKGWSIEHLVAFKNDKLYFANGDVISAKKDENLQVKYNNHLYIFDENNLHIKTKNAKTSKILYSFTYDKNKSLKSIKDNFNNITSFDKSNDNLIITTPHDKKIICKIDEKNDLTSIKFPDDFKISYLYENHFLIQKTDANLNVYHYEYKNNKISKITDPENASWEFKTKKIIKPENEIEKYTSTYHDKTLTTSKVINDETILSKMLDFKTNSTIYDECGVKKQIFYEDLKDFYLNKKLVKKIVQTKPSGLEKITTFKRDYESNNSQLTKKINTKNTNGKISQSVMDFQNHKLTNISPSGKKQEIFLDEENIQTKKVKSPNIFDTIYSHDKKGRITKVSQGLRYKTYTYDENGNLKEIFSFPSLRKTSYFYDENNRLIKQIFPDKQEVSYEYDGNSNLLSIKAPNGIYDFAYNGINKIIHEQNPTNIQNIYEYDKQRRLTKILKPSRDFIAYSYKNAKLDQVMSKTKQISYEYECENIKSITTDEENINYTYDGDLLTKIYFGGILDKSIDFTYNNDFLISSMTYADIKEKLFYDHDGILKQIGDLSITIDDKSNQIKSIHEGNFNIDYSYNKYGELKSKKSTPYTLNIQKIGDKITSKNEYIKDKNKLIGKLNTYIYTYDKRGRVTSLAKNLIIKEQYAYDESSNLTTIKVNDKILKATYDKDNNMLSLGDINYTYTKDGYLKSRTHNNQTTTYSYDVFGNLKELKTPSKTISYEHSPTHQIIAKKINGEIVEKYLWLNLKLLAIYDKNDKLKTRYFYGNEQVPYKMIKNGKIYYMYYNQINSLKLITDKNGKIIKQLDYDAYGNIIKDTNKSFLIKIGFAGGFMDEDTKLIRFGKRDYNPEQRRWTALDPIGFEGGDLNLYGYVLGDPVSKIDPTGEKEAIDQYADKIKKLLKLCDKDGNVDCNKLAFKGHEYCIKQGPAGYICQKAVDLLFKRCMLNKIKCKTEEPKNTCKNDEQDEE